jgi:uncharacterized membrane protein
MSIHKRVASIDLLRGAVMIIMALDHVRGYFHYDAFWYSPTDLSRTSVPLFITRWITHFSAPVFVFLAGVSAYLYGIKRSKRELSFFLLTRGTWLVLVELLIIALFRSFNPTYPYFNLQVIWAIGISMIALSAIVYLDKRIILAIGILIVAGHNALDGVHFPGNLLWSVLHEPGVFHFGDYTIFVRYPVLPWLGVMALGYYFGHLYHPSYDARKRKRLLLLLGIEAIVLFILLRVVNLYGDAAWWSPQRNFAYSVLSFFNVTKYPPSFLFVLITLGPSLIFLSVTEKLLRRWSARVAVFGRVPMFYYLAHILLIHLLAIVAAYVSGYHFQDMAVLSTPVNDAPALKGYGFNLTIVYMIWISVVIILYPFCKLFDRYKKTYQKRQWWLSYM